MPDRAFSEYELDASEWKLTDKAQRLRGSMLVRDDTIRLLDFIKDGHSTPITYDEKLMLNEMEKEGYIQHLRGFKE